MNILDSIGAFIFSVGLAVSGFLGFGQAPVQETVNLGVALPSATAVFETSLASPISSSATSLTLAANSVRGGGSLSGYNCFTVDEGSAQAETICGTVSGTTVTSLTRGISQATGTTTVAALQFSHRRGANVKITDFPLIQILKAQNNGEDSFPNPIKYDSIATTTLDNDRNNLASWGLVADTAFSGAGAIPASDTVQGYVEMATGAEAAASTNVGGTGARLALGANIATSTFNSATAANVIPVTGGTGKIDNYFIATTTLFTNGSVATSSFSIGAFPAWHIGKQVQVFSSTGTTTFAVPSGITKVFVTTVGAGGGGGVCNAGASNGSGGGGAGAGGIAIETVDVTATSSIQVFVGTGGTATLTGGWSTFGTNGFFNSASGGVGGLDEDDGSAGGIGSGGDLNIRGGGGASGMADVALAVGFSGAGGSNAFGGGGAGVTSAGGGATGNAGGAYGGGGGGGACQNGSAGGGTGGNGVVIVRW